MSSMVASPTMSPIGNGALIVAFFGAGTAWASGTTTLSLAQGAGSIAGFTVTGPTTAHVTFTPAANTPSAILFTMSSGESAAFAVYGTEPSCTAAPAAAPAGRTTTIVLTGAGTQWTAATGISLSAGSAAGLVIDPVAQTITFAYTAPAAPQIVTIGTTDGLSAQIGVYLPALLAGVPVRR